MLGFWLFLPDRSISLTVSRWISIHTCLTPTVTLKTLTCLIRFHIHDFVLSKKKVWACLRFWYSKWAWWPTSRWVTSSKYPKAHQKGGGKTKASARWLPPLLTLWHAVLVLVLGCEVASCWSSALVWVCVRIWGSGFIDNRVTFFIGDRWCC